MNLQEINAFRVSHGLTALEVSKPKKKNNNAALRAMQNRDIKSKRMGKGK